MAEPDAAMGARPALAMAGSVTGRWRGLERAEGCIGAENDATREEEEDGAATEPIGALCSRGHAASSTGEEDSVEGRELESDRRGGRS